MLSTEARKILVDSKLVSESKSLNTYAYVIPKQSLDTSTDFLFLFEDIKDEPTSFGSDDFLEFEQQVNLKIIFPSGYSGDYSDLKMRVIKALKDNNFLFASNPGGVSALPDSDRRHMRLMFNRVVSVQ